MNIIELTAKATDKVMKVTSSTIAIARLMKVKPADLVGAIFDREANDEYRAAMVTFAVPFVFDEAKKAEAEAKKQPSKKE